MEEEKALPTIVITEDGTNTKIECYNVASGTHQIIMLSNALNYIQSEMARNAQRIMKLPGSMPPKLRN